MESKKSNKITDIVRLRQMIKKWKKLAVASAPSPAGSGGSKSIKFLAVSVGEEQRRFVIPTEYLAHGAFAALLKEAEEEFGFGQEGVLRIPCEVGLFQGILKVVEKNKDCRCHVWYCSPETELVGSDARQLPPKPVCR